MNIEPVTNIQPNLQFGDETSGGQDAIRTMIAAMYAALKQSGTEQGSQGGSSQDAGKAMLAAVDKAMQGGGILENQRFVGTAIANALSEGTSSEEDVGRAIGALGDFSQDGFTEVDASAVQDLLQKRSGEAADPQKQQAGAGDQGGDGGSGSVASGSLPVEPETGAGAEGSAGQPEAVTAQSAVVAARTDSANTGASDPDAVLKQGSVGTFKTSDYGQQMGNNKKTVMDALDKAGASEKEKSLVLAMFMMETNSMSVDDRDSSKDGRTDGARNVSALNMNISMLEKDPARNNPGVSTYDPSVNYNDQANAGLAAEVCLQGIRERGEGAWIAGHRGGAEAARRFDETGTAVRPGNQDDVSYYGEFNNSIATAYAAIVADTALLSNNKRVETDSKPVYG